MNGANGMSDIEHLATGESRGVGGKAARVAGASTGSASDQGKNSEGSCERARAAE